MATIPLYNHGEALPAPGAAELSRVPPARMNLDYGGLTRVAAQAYQEPTMPKNMYEGDRVAGEAWGQALQTLGKTMKVVFEETAKIKNEGDIADADARMVTTLGEYEIGLANNPNEESWLNGWANQVEGLRKEFGSNKGLSPYARHHIEMRLQRMETAGQVRISSMTMNHQRQKAALSLDNLERIHREQRNFDGMRAVSRRRTEVNLQSKEQEEVRNYEIDTMERVDGLYQAIDANPKTALEQLDARNADGKHAHFSWLDARSREEARNHADGTLRNRRSRILEDVAEFVSTSDGQPIYPDDIDAFDPNGYLTAGQRSDVRSYIAGKIPRNRKADYEQAASIIDNYRKQDDPDGYKLADLKYGISTGFEGPHQEQLLSRLNKHLSALERTLPPMGEVTAILNYWMERGAFGEYTKPKGGLSDVQMPANETGESLGEKTQDLMARLFLLSNGLWPAPWERFYHEQGETRVPVTADVEVNEILKARAADKVQRIRETLEFERENGGFSTVDDIKRRAVQLALNMGARLPKPAEWGGSPRNNDLSLPSSPGDMSGENPLLPRVRLTPAEANERMNSAISKSQSSNSK